MIPAAEAPTVDPWTACIGQIGVTEHWVVTPNGTARLHDTQWIIRDHVTVTRRSGWLLVFGFGLLWLLFIGLVFIALAMRTRVGGYVEVTVWSPDVKHVEQVWVHSIAEAQAVHAAATAAQRDALTQRAAGS